jgi:hypothetical protein
MVVAKKASKVERVVLDTVQSTIKAAHGASSQSGGSAELAAFLEQAGVGAAPNGGGAVPSRRRRDAAALVGSVLHCSDAESEALYDLVAVSAAAPSAAGGRDGQETDDDSGVPLFFLDATGEGAADVGDEIDRLVAKRGYAEEVGAEEDDDDAVPTGDEDSEVGEASDDDAKADVEAVDTLPSKQNGRRKRGAAAAADTVPDATTTSTEELPEPPTPSRRSARKRVKAAA